MRKKRQFKAGRCYHLVSRIAHRAFFFDEASAHAAGVSPVDAPKKWTVLLGTDPLRPTWRRYYEEPTYYLIGKWLAAKMSITPIDGGSPWTVEGSVNGFGIQYGEE